MNKITDQMRVWMWSIWEVKGLKMQDDTLNCGWTIYYYIFEDVFFLSPSILTYLELCEDIFKTNKITECWVQMYLTLSCLYTGITLIGYLFTY